MSWRFNIRPSQRDEYPGMVFGPPQAMMRSKYDQRRLQRMGWLGVYRPLNKEKT